MTTGVERPGRSVGDDLPWRWADAGNNESVVVVGLAPGSHKILIELATPEHEVIAGKAVSFALPAASTANPETPHQLHTGETEQAIARSWRKRKAGRRHSVRVFGP